MTTILASDVLNESFFDVLEQSTPRYTATILDDSEQPIGAGSLATLLLTLYVVRADGSYEYLNSRNDQDILNANNVTVDANGVLVWAVQIADTTLVEPALPFERHCALFEWTWLSGGSTRSGKKKIILNVKNLAVVI